MPGIPFVSFIGHSGKKYLFEVRYASHYFDSAGGVYIHVTSFHFKKERKLIGFRYIPLQIGEASDLRKELSSYFIRNKLDTAPDTTSICVLFDEDPTFRRSVVEDLSSHVEHLSQLYEENRLDPSTLQQKLLELSGPHNIPL